VSLQQCWRKRESRVGLGFSRLARKA